MGTEQTRSYRQRLSRRSAIRGVLTASLGVAAASLLAACGTTATPAAAPTTVPAAAPTTAAAAAAPTTAPAAAAPTTAPQPVATVAPTAAAKPQAAVPSGTTLVIYATQNTDPPISTSEQQVVNGFEDKNPDTKVKVQFWPGQNFYDKLRVLAAANQMPDAIDMESKILPDFVFRKLVSDITSMVNTAGIKQDDYWPNQWLKHQITGKMWAFPLDSQDVVLFYNKTVFDKAGVPYPPSKWDDPSWTWDKLIETATKLTQGSGATKVFGFNHSTWWVYDYPVIWSSGGTILNADHTTSTITMPETVDAFQLRADLINKYKVHPTPAEITEGADHLFAGGRLAMNAIWSPWAYIIKGNKDLVFDMAPMPKGKAGAFTRAPSDCIAIGAQSKQPESTFKFARYLTGADGLKLMDIEAGLGIPPLRSLSDDFLHPKVKGLENLNWQVVLDVEGQQHAKFQDVTVKWPEMDKLIGAEHDILLAGKETAKDFATKLDPKVNDLLKSIPAEQRGFIGD
jgi:multiple sugar transport system substrate-binding protein